MPAAVTPTDQAICGAARSVHASMGVSCSPRQALGCDNDEAGGGALVRCVPPSH